MNYNIEKYCKEYLEESDESRRLITVLSYDLNNIDLQIELLVQHYKMLKNKGKNEEAIKIRLNYKILLEKISKEQGLGLHWNEISLIINTDIATYIHAVITYEDDEYIVIIVVDETGAEFAKILNKNSVLSVEIIYQQMLEKPKNIKWGCMYA